MRIRWRNFELPNNVQPDADTLTGEHGRFVIEPFERGFGHTIGNGLRRVLLSSIEGAAVTAVRIDGASHEYDSLEGVYEDVAEIILNIKRLRVNFEGDGPIICRINRSEEGPVTGADVIVEGDGEVANPDLHLCLLTMDRDFVVELDVSKGRGYVPSDDNPQEEHGLGTIPVDAIYSPVQRVRYSIEATRVGKFTNYERLVLEIWTDGTVTPEMALTDGAKISRKHLNPFVIESASSDDDPLLESPAESGFNEVNRETDELTGILAAPLSDLELSVRARNCLDSANMHTMRDLVSMSEADVMTLKNLGKTSLQEIRTKLADRGLRLGMAVVD
jgi:DNA-directed RNA polymerase subunit alpha